MQAWWQDPSLGLIGAFAETARSNGLWQRRYVAQGELYLGPFTLRGQAGFVPSDKQGLTELQGGSSASPRAGGTRSTRSA